MLPPNPMKRPPPPPPGLLHFPSAPILCGTIRHISDLLANEEWTLRPRETTLQTPPEQTAPRRLKKKNHSQHAYFY